MVYLNLLHGQKDLCQPSSGWGIDGPVLGPLDWIHSTLGNVRIMSAEGEEVCLSTLDDRIFYNGIYYGDWSIVAEDQLGILVPDSAEQISEAKARLVTIRK